jgi:hypothetical protein
MDVFKVILNNEMTEDIRIKYNLPKLKPGSNRTYKDAINIYLL